MESNKFLTANEVATEFGIDERELQKFVDAKEVQALADRGIWKYRRDELQALVDAGKIAEPNASLWMDDASPAEGQILTVDRSGDDDLSYIELDEDALAEQATMITKSNPLEDRTPVDEVATADNWFVPSDADEMRSQPTEVDHSSNDVSVVSEAEAVGEHTLGAAALSDEPLSKEASHSDSIFDVDSPVSLSDSDSDVRIAGSASNLLGSKVSSKGPGPIDSDSDVMIAADVPGGMLEGSGIVLDFDFGAGATVSSSGSSLRLPQTNVNDETSAWDAIEATGSDVLSGSSLGQPAATKENSSDSSVRLGDDDSGISLFGPSESGIVLEGDSRLGFPPTDSSVLLSNVDGVTDDSSLDMATDDDSGLTLESIQEGSGLSLESSDSGLSLAAADSGLTLETAGDSGISLTSPDQTLSDEDGLGATMMFDADAGEQTQVLDITSQSDDDSSFDMNFTDTSQTAELQLDDDDDFEEMAATVIKPGKGKSSPGLTEAFQLDDAPEVEELDIADDLNAAINDDDEDAPALDEDDEVFEASEETFSDEHEATDGDDDDDEFASADAIVAAKDTGPREPSWGMGMSIGLIACSLVLVANSLVLWSGVTTMWSGAEASGPAAAVIAQLAGLIP